MRAEDVRCVVVGSSGMLGHKMLQHLSRVFPHTTGLQRGNGIDAADFPRILTERRPDYIVNCVGIIKQREEARDAVASIEINSLLPHRLAALADEWGGRLIHFSSDCVFSGNRGGYREDDPADATDLYGRSKLLGEVIAPNALTLRTSIIGRELHGRLGLLEWFLGQNGRTVRGFRRAIWSGVTTNHLARLVARIIREHPRLSGLYHVAAGPISKYDLLCLLRGAYSADIEIVPDDGERCDRSLDGSKLHQAIGYTPPPWDELIGEMASDPTPYESWNTHEAVAR